jgi:uncharacterized protein YkwD
VHGSRVITVCLLVLAFAALPGSASASHSRAQAAGTMVGKINQVRVRKGLRPLRVSSALNGSAGRFASFLMRRGVLAHRSRVSAGGHFRRLGEALAMCSGSSPAVGHTVRMWLGSPSHRAVLLTRSMNLVGVGLSRGRFHGRRASIWVLQTGRR